MKLTTALNCYRHSVERNAIYHKVFYSAKKVIKEQMKNNHLKPHTWGIIVDIDEPLLDNFISFQYGKADLTELEQIIFFTTPSAKKFIESIRELGGVVNLVTNRSIARQKETIAKLKSSPIFFDQILFSNKNLVLLA